MYHHAALIHLHRRVFKHAKTHPSVQDAVRHIETLQMDVKTGSPAEKRLLFPLFTASCNAQEQGEIYEVRMRQKAWEDLVERLDFFG
jgi:iron-sulfur cluster repair protein YtfE (RIC family)